MTDYPLIRELGLEITKYTLDDFGRSSTFYIRAGDLEKLLMDSPVIEGVIGTSGGWVFSDAGKGLADRTHTARLIGIKPLSQAVSRSEIKDLLDDKAPTYDIQRMISLLTRIQEHGLRGDE